MSEQNNKSTKISMRMSNELFDFIKVFQEKIGATSYSRAIVVLLHEIMCLVTTKPGMLDKLIEENKND